MKDAKDYNLEIIRRTSLSSSDLAGICADIPIDSHYTSEIVAFNDYYGNAEQIKRFLNIPSHYPLKAAMQHGNQYGEAYWDEEIKEILPVSLAWGEHICSIWKKHTTKEIYKVGAPFFYTQSLLSEEGIKSERARLGKNLLVFPAHSMHNSTVSFDMESWIDNIRLCSKGFDSVRICIYWKDYILGRHKKYLEAGYECVSAGHIFDYNFLPRLRSLIEVSDATMSNRIGSFIGYSIFLRKPHRYIDQYMDIADNEIGRVKEEEEAWRGDPGVQKIFKAFSTNDDFQITPDQLDALEPYFGFSEIKSKSEFLEIVNRSELLYEKRGRKDKSRVFWGEIALQNDMPTKLKATIKAIAKCAWHVLPLSTRRRIMGADAPEVLQVNTKFGELNFRNVNGMTAYRAETFFTKEPETLSWIDSFVNGAVLWDIGANVGLYSCYAVRASKAKVIAFEPHPFNIEILTRNVILNGMSDDISIYTLPLAQFCQEGNFNMSCCYSGASGASFIENYGEDGNQMNEFKSIKLFGSSADAFMNLYKLDCPDYVKLDVDGIEYLILEGMQEILANKKLKSILVECCDLFEQQKNSIDDLLRNFGFNLSKVGKSPLYAEGVDSHTHNYIYNRL